ncbi:MAG: Flp family type IVb pilin [Alphaproteobacteria bacterium]|mgnify:FL=1|jgi:pilus assembly protein Flp/PilA|nr:Flp family type IVb pilin [Alphaproteobacteria bacterium]MBT4016915.1 Flp family type IVb pilin [Alphaproteobacteria bacterium]MBT4964943.1 Flp family type IVb pilin [Alphaproteobacteria bacterium]MBT5161754.1 Flp family type IVb pilin [Alphaproteobacteria bacterium]MBT6384951.1 Flp family type IVb pilin [Alphaproteobacteria bacterium]
MSKKHEIAQLTIFARNEDGVTAVEYGLIAGLISVTIIAVLLTLGGDLTNVFNDISGGLQNGRS